MGLLTQGTPLSWEETKKLSNHVRDHGIQQFINFYRRWKHRTGDVFKWGDEVEYIVVKFDNENKVARLSLCAPELLPILNQKEIDNPIGVNSLWRPEFGSFMLESSPGQPYEGLSHFINEVEPNMKYRRKEVSELLLADEALMTISNFPRLGTPNFTWPIYKPQPKSGVSHSLYFPDEAISTNDSRYSVITRNIRKRRGKKVDTRVNIFIDEHTYIPVIGAPADNPDAVCMDATGFGTSCCSLQTTFQAFNETEARFLYDQLASLCPVMLALTAAAPVFRGYLVDSDSRWNVLRTSLDSRTSAELGEVPLKENQFRISKSRCDSIDSYLSPDGEKYNDVPLIYDKKIYQKLRDGDVDHLLAQHIAHLFIRDPVVLISEKVYQNDEEETHHFENIQSSNWQSMRLKPPLLNSDIGWRVEFRPCELQITDFENAAIACFMALLTRVILTYNLNLLVPISKVDENMQRAQKRNACQVERFWFRKNMFSKQMNVTNGCSQNGIQSADDEFELMTIDQIMNGNGSSFPGLIPLISEYLSSQTIDSETSNTVQNYLQLIQRRASGELLTTASWIRKEITGHPEYKKDSIVTERINFDLLKKMQEIQEGKRSCTELHGSLI